MQTRSTGRNNEEKNVWEKSNDAFSSSIRVQSTMRHISICFSPQYERQRIVFFRERAEKRIARHLDVNMQRGWTLIENGKLVNQITGSTHS